MNKALDDFEKCEEFAEMDDILGSMLEKAEKSKEE